MAFMFETRFPQHADPLCAPRLETLQDNYIDCWSGPEEALQRHARGRLVLSRSAGAARHQGRPGDQARAGRGRHPRCWSSAAACIVVDCGLGVTRGLVDAGHQPARRSTWSSSRICIPTMCWNWGRCCTPPGRPGWRRRSRPWPGRHRPLLAALPAVDGSSTSRSASSTKAGRTSATWFRSSEFRRRRGARRGRPERHGAARRPSAGDRVLCAALRACRAKASYSRPTRRIFRRSPISRRGADILVHEAMLEEGIERLVARTGNGARLKEHLLASHTMAERCRPHRRRGRASGISCSIT